ncbi:sugar transferase [Arthrobacter sp. H35-D1]|uniref:sugar transferase n=1 Tax=Arthrobacter sp. H35-D1 TaxID=3046202 RepID=UPI0024BB6A52|nr:sugar transferase [Arthrobacter sp. H35-D1]MDJ0312344.1 sugar transferase [Arthrobacter sp. H35-D1]
MSQLQAPHGSQGPGLARPGHARPANPRTAEANARADSKENSSGRQASRRLEQPHRFLRWPGTDLARTGMHLSGGALPAMLADTASAAGPASTPVAHHLAATKNPTSADWAKSFLWRLRISDLLITVIVVYVAFAARFSFAGTAGPSTTTLQYAGLGLLIVALWNLDLEIFRTRERTVVGAGAAEYRRVLNSTLRSFGAPAIVLIVFDLQLVRGFFAVALPLGICLLVASRWMWRNWLGRQRARGRSLSGAVVVGEAKDVRYVITQLSRNLSAGYKVAGVALTTPQDQIRLQAPWHEVPEMANSEDIASTVKRTGAQTVIVAGKLPGGPAAVQELGWRLGDMSCELVLASSLTNVAGPRVHFRPVEGLPLMHVELPQYSGGKHVIKRAMDVVLSAVALLLLAPLLGALALIVRLDSHGPSFFHQERVGRNGKPFTMVKFRSMVSNAEQLREQLAEANEGSGVLFKLSSDPRVTRAGQWMRRYSLDELPQFWNVLLGHMSLVGPRPPLATEVAGYERPTHRRLLIKPGITGLWQINGRSDLEWNEAVRLDLYYVENWSLTGDTIILWRTFKAVYRSTGAY